MNDEYRTTDEAFAYWQSLSDDEREGMAERMRMGDPTWKQDLTKLECEHVLAAAKFSESPQERARFKREREERVNAGINRVNEAWARGMLVVNDNEWSKEDCGEKFVEWYASIYDLQNA